MNNKSKAIDFPKVVLFDWDRGNLTKSKRKHKIEPVESEQVFTNNPVYFYDERHSQAEDRYFAYGITNTGRRLFVAFTIRYNKVRIISARGQNKKERVIYEKAQKNTAV